MKRTTGSTAARSFANDSEQVTMQRRRVHARPLMPARSATEAILVAASTQPHATLTEGRHSRLKRPFCPISPEGSGFGKES